MLRILTDANKDNKTFGSHLVKTEMLSSEVIRSTSIPGDPNEINEDSERMLYLEKYGEKIYDLMITDQSNNRALNGILEATSTSMRKLTAIEISAFGL